MVLPVRSGSEDFDPGAWDPATLAILRQAVAEASAMHQVELDDQSDGGRAILKSATKAVADLALTGVRDPDRLINYARVAIEGSLVPEDRSFRKRESGCCAGVLPDRN
jgi:hypothetical protein